MIRTPKNRHPTHPGEILVTEFLGPMKISPHQLADAIYLPHHRLQELVNLKCGVTPGIAVRLAKFFGMSADFWLNLQMRWDLFNVSQQEAIELAAIEPHKTV